MPRMTGQQALVEMLRAEGVRYVFGNPGTTELPFLDALQDAPDIQYVTSLFEGVAAGMADGYARITQRPSFMNFHISVGVSNSIAVMYNSWRGGTPMVRSVWRLFIQRVYVGTRSLRSGPRATFSPTMLKSGATDAGVLFARFSSILNP